MAKGPARIVQFHRADLDYIRKVGLEELTPQVDWAVLVFEHNKDGLGVVYSDHDKIKLLGALEYLKMRIMEEALDD